jgi:NTP pyrophosphatase (non-canonical NTP hydrolase)
MVDLYRDFLFDESGIVLYQVCISIFYWRITVSHERKFSERNRIRCESPKGFGHRLDSWSLSDWMVAVCGECGEAANIVKKLNRYRDGIPGNSKTKEELMEDLKKELGDISVYLDLMAQAIGCDLEILREDVFQRKSEMIGYKEEV